MIDYDTKVAESNEQNNTCSDSVTVTEELGRIIVRKVTVPSESEDSFDFSLTGNNGFSLSGGGEHSVVVAEGTYTITENVPEGWMLSGISCEYEGESVGEAAPPNGETVTVEAGDTIICNFTNTKLGQIIIQKVTEPEQDEDGVSFNFQTNYTEDEINLSGENEYLHESEWLMPGEYSISEQALEGWDLTSVICSDDSDPEEIELEPGEIVTCVFTNTERGSVQLEKFADPNEGFFTFNLNGPSTPEPLSWTGSGSGLWQNIFPGGYTLSEILPEGWSGLQTIGCGTSGSDEVDVTSDNGSIQFNLMPGEEKLCIFNNTQYGVITGKKFNDKNANGEKNRKEGGIKNWLIELWMQGDPDFDLLAEDGGLPPGDPDFDLLRTVNTGKGGNYKFENLAPGVYRVCEGMREQWRQTYPAQGIECPNGTVGYQFDMRAGEIKSNQDFGNFSNGSISGRKFNDINGNGKKGGRGESWLSGWTVYLDTNNNSLLDEGEPMTTTDEQGKYKFYELAPGTYTVREVMRDGWIQTKPAGETQSYTVIIESGKKAKKKDFGNMQISTVVGYKWEDMNGDGIWDKDELAREGWHVALGRALPDPNPEDQTIPIEIVALSLTGSDGKYILPAREPGNYKVFEERRDGWHTTNPPAIDSFFDIEYRIDLATAPSSLALDSFFDVFVEFSSGQIVTHDINEHQLNFGNWHSPLITGYKWDDVDGNGAWNHETERGIEGWNMALGRVGEPHQGEDGHTHIPIEIITLSLTGSNGEYGLSVPRPGHYMILEENRNGWQVTVPAPQHIDSFFDIEYRIGLINPPQLNKDSFFDVFVEMSGQQFEQNFIFGNHELGRQETGEGGDENVGDGDSQMPIDICSNIDGIQTSVPDGMELVNGSCVQSTTASEKNNNNGNGMLFTPGGNVNNSGQVLGIFTSMEEQIAHIRSQIDALQQRLMLVLREELRRLIQALINTLQAQIDTLNQNL